MRAGVEGDTIEQRRGRVRQIAGLCVRWAARDCEERREEWKVEAAPWIGGREEKNQRGRWEQMRTQLWQTPLTHGLGDGRGVWVAASRGNK